MTRSPAETSRRALIESLESRTVLAATPKLSADDVRQLLAQAASQTMSSTLDQTVIVVVDREGNTLGTFARSGNTLDNVGKDIVTLATVRARTAALFESKNDAFTTRTARFIIQDHFPEPVKSTPGGPLYGVQFSNLVGSDIVSSTPAIDGDPGGIPLFKDGEPVGGIGVAGDFHDVAARLDLMNLLKFYKANPDKLVFNGKEEHDVDEAVALAGAQGFMAPKNIRANRITIDGLALPFTKDDPLTGGKAQTLAQLVSSGKGSIVGTIKSTPNVPFTPTTIAGIPGELRRRDLINDPTSTNYGFISSNDVDRAGHVLPAADRLTKFDVSRAITRAVTQATKTRAGIRLPIGQITRVYVTIVDRDGDLLGAFRMQDTTNFSYDVAVQKARTAAFFSDNTHAFSTRAIGFLSQQYFPIGIESDAVGPLYHLQNGLSPNLALPTSTRGNRRNPLPNGITVFPGGFPLYKNSHLVGAIGVSGDGVDQDDRVAFAGAGKLQPPASIRSDTLPHEQTQSFIASRAGELINLFGTGPAIHLKLGGVSLDDVTTRLKRLNFRLPYEKEPRNPEL